MERCVVVIPQNRVMNFSKYFSKYFSKFKKAPIDKELSAFIEDIIFTVSLACFDKLDKTWTTDYPIPVNFNQDQLLKCTKRKCSSTFVNQGCKVLLYIELDRIYVVVSTFS